MRQTLGANKTCGVYTYCALCIILPLAGSLLNPVLSLYMSSYLNFSSLQISIIFLLLPLITINVGQFVAYLSDKGLQRPLIISVAALFGMLSNLFLTTKPSFALMASLGLIILGLYPLGFSQLFASAREYSLSYMTSSVKFTTFLRALVSFAWVFGPPLAFFIVDKFSFSYLFYGSAFVYALLSIYTFLFLPHIEMKNKAITQGEKPKLINKNTLLLFISVALLFTAFSAYITSMPLYITKELKFDGSRPGLMMGLAAFLEIPIMLLVPRLTKRIGLKIIMFTGSFSLIAYLLLFANMQMPNSFMYIQIFSSLFIALVSTTGMVYFQELLPHIAGQSTTLYINAVTAGQILGGALIAIASLGSYKYIYDTGSILTLIAIILLFFVKKPDTIH